MKSLLWSPVSKSVPNDTLSALPPRILFFGWLIVLLRRIVRIGKVEGIKLAMFLPPFPPNFPFCRQGPGPSRWTPLSEDGTPLQR